MTRPPLAAYSNGCLLAGALALGLALGALAGALRAGRPW